MKFYEVILTYDNVNNDDKKFDSAAVIKVDEEIDCFEDAVSNENYIPAYIDNIPTSSENTLKMSKIFHKILLK